MLTLFWVLFGPCIWLSNLQVVRRFKMVSLNSIFSAHSVYSFRYNDFVCFTEATKKRAFQLVQRAYSSICADDLAAFLGMSVSEAVDGKTIQSLDTLCWYYSQWLYAVLLCYTILYTVNCCSLIPEEPVRSWSRLHGLNEEFCLKQLLKPYFVMLGCVIIKIQYVYQDTRTRYKIFYLSFCAYNYTHIRLVMQKVYNNIIYISIWYKHTNFCSAR